MRILVVEDEKDIASFIKKALVAENFVVDVALEGEKGRFLALTNDYDLVILDINLPDISGIEVCEKIRKKKKELCIIMLTVETDVKSKVEALNIGADDYLTKPFALEELLARIRALLRRGKTITGDILQVADLVLNTKGHIVKRADRIIDLSKKEFTLFEYFMRNPGTVLTRGMILEHVWDINADPFTNTVDVHVRLLRKKIDDRHKRKFIHTVHGYGYKLE